MMLCKELSFLGHEVCVLSGKYDRNAHENIEHVRIPVNTRSSSTKNLSFHQNCQKVLGRLRFDWTYALSRTYPVDAFRVSDPLHARWMKVRYPRRLLRKLQELNPRHRAILWLEKNILNTRNTKIVITNSKLVKNQIVEEYGYPADRIHVIYNGVDLERFSPNMSHGIAVKRGDGLVLLFVAMDFKRKGLHFLLDSLAVLRRENIKARLLVVGKDKERVYRKKVRSLGIGEAVRFVGEVDNVEDYYRVADLFVLPTRYDPFANVCLEAMACGTPVITTVSNGASELIDEGENGYVIKNQGRLIEELTDKIRIFSKLPDERKQEMRKKARLKSERFSIRENVLRTVNLFATELERLNERLRTDNA